MDVRRSYFVTLITFSFCICTRIIFAYGAYQSSLFLGNSHCDEKLILRRLHRSCTVYGGETLSYPIAKRNSPYPYNFYSDSPQDKFVQFPYSFIPYPFPQTERNLAIYPEIFVHPAVIRNDRIPPYVSSSMQQFGPVNYPNILNHFKRLRRQTGLMNLVLKCCSPLGCTTRDFVDLERTYNFCD